MFVSKKMYGVIILITLDLRKKSGKGRTKGRVKRSEGGKHE